VTEDCTRKKDTAKKNSFLMVTTGEKKSLKLQIKQQNADCRMQTEKLIINAEK
jgi:hypothetical protein